MALLEARPYRPFKSSEEYLEAMKEDLAEWLSTLYPELMINAENFMDRLDTGVALCKHANYVRQAAEDYLAKRQARNKSMTRSMTSGLAGPILALGNVYYLPAAKSGTFFARDNVSNFITWCRKSLKIIECLLFETDDLIMRKNEKHVILCLLEVARRGAKFGMLAPMLVQMERQIDREIAADNKANGIGSSTETAGDGSTSSSKNLEVSIQTNVASIGLDSAVAEPDIFDTDSENEDDSDDGPMLMYGPQPQIITNDLKSLDEMVRDLVEKCTCPSQFPMVRVSEGKYRIGDTKVLIFVRILRSHVMVRVGGGWDTLSHYLDKHDPCRCKSQHRSAIAARLIPRNSNQNNGIELHKAQVIFERSPPTARRIISNFNSQTATSTATAAAATTTTAASETATATGAGAASTTNNNLLPSFGNKQRSRSPTPQRKFLNQQQQSHTESATATTPHVSAEKPEKQTPAASLLTSPSLARRSMSPSPRRLTDMRKKQSSLDACINGSSGHSSASSSGPKSLPLMAGSGGASSASVTANGIELPAPGGHSAHSGHSGSHVQFECPTPESAASGGAIAAAASTPAAGTNGDGNGSTAANKFDNISDNGSEISDEGYRSLGVVQSNAQKRESLHSQASMEDAESNARLDQTSSDSPLSPVDDAANKLPEILDAEFDVDNAGDNVGPQSLPAMLGSGAPGDKFEQPYVFIIDEEVTVDIAGNTGLRRTDFSHKIIGRDADAAPAAVKQQPQRAGSKIPCSPVAQRRRRSSIDNSTCNSGSLQDLSSRSGLPVFNRNKPVYRSVRKSLTDMQQQHHREVAPAARTPLPRRQLPSAASSGVRDVTNTWSGRSAATPTLASKKRPSIHPETFVPPAASAAAPASSASASTLLAFERSDKTRSSQILYDSNGRRVRSCTNSLTTSPVKNHAASPLAQQLLEAASSAKNDAQILEKMKALLSRYAASNQTRSPAAAANAMAAATAAPSTALPTVALTAAAAPTTTTTTTTTAAAAATSTDAGNNKKSAVYEDFTSAWVHSNGNLERSNSCMPPTTKATISKRSSAASSCDSANSRDLSTVVSPRRERGMSKIPAPVRQHTELY